MTEIIINNYELPIREYNGQRVVTFKDIDAVHQRPEGTARRNFNNNKKHFIAGTDYYKIQPYEKRTVGITSPNGGIIVTESGYLMLVKSFTDKLAWQVQRELVNTYFKVKRLDAGSALLGKDEIDNWKWTVSTPLIEKLNLINGNDNSQRIYKMVYRDMTTNFGFNMNAAKLEFCQKYNVPVSEVPIINAVAANMELRKQFLESVQNCMRELSEKRIQDIHKAIERIGILVDRANQISGDSGDKELIDYC